MAVLVELKARFDEEANIRWARALEAVGAHVVYGLPNFKTHCKACLVVRQEAERHPPLLPPRHRELQRQDRGPLRRLRSLHVPRRRSARTLTELFNLLTGYMRPRPLNHLLVAPTGLRPALIERIRREAEHARAGRQRQDRPQDEQPRRPDPHRRALRGEPRPGWTSTLIVRGICCLRPQVPGVSDRIRVISDRRPLPRARARVLVRATAASPRSSSRPPTGCRATSITASRSRSRRRPGAHAAGPRAFLQVQLADNVKARVIGSRRRLAPSQPRRQAGRARCRTASYELLAGRCSRPRRGRTEARGGDPEPPPDDRADAQRPRRWLRDGHLPLPVSRRGAGAQAGAAVRRGEVRAPDFASAARPVEPTPPRESERPSGALLVAAWTAGGGLALPADAARRGARGLREAEDGGVAAGAAGEATRRFERAVALGSPAASARRLTTEATRSTTRPSATSSPAFRSSAATATSASSSAVWPPSAASPTGSSPTNGTWTCCSRERQGGGRTGLEITQQNIQWNIDVPGLAGRHGPDQPAGRLQPHDQPALLRHRKREQPQAPPGAPPRYFEFDDRQARVRALGAHRVARAPRRHGRRHLPLRRSRSPYATASSPRTRPPARRLGVRPLSLVTLAAGIVYDTRDNEIFPPNGQLSPGRPARDARAARWTASVRYGEAGAMLATYRPIGGPFILALPSRGRPRSSATSPSTISTRAARSRPTRCPEGPPAIRGVPEGRYSGLVKVFGNAELRALLVRFRVFGPALPRGEATSSSTRAACGRTTRSPRRSTGRGSASSGEPEWARTSCGARRRSSASRSRTRPTPPRRTRTCRSGSTSRTASCSERDAAASLTGSRSASHARSMRASISSRRASRSCGLSGVTWMRMPPAMSSTATRAGVRSGSGRWIPASPPPAPSAAFWTSGGRAAAARRCRRSS